MKQSKVLQSEDGQRLDVLVSSKWDITRSRAQSLIKEGCVWVNERASKPSYKVQAGEAITIEIPEPTAIEAKPQKMDLDIVYEDSHIIVINKPRGMVVHPSPGHADGTLVNALLYHCKNLSGIGGQIRPGIVHRIDKDTTGLLVVAKDDEAHLSLSQQIKDKEAAREYKALVEGVVKEDEGEVIQPIGRHRSDRKKMAIIPNGKEAQTLYRVEKRYKDFTLVDAKLRTGRTHQIRVHMAYIHHPVVGDKVYGYKKQRFNLEGQMLHAARLKLTHPISGEVMTFEAPLPDDFANLLEKLR